LALAAMLFAVSMTFIDQTIVAIAAPQLQNELGLTRAGTQWVVNAYLLALAGSFALGGRLADVLGHRRMVLIGIVGFAASSALCGATPRGSYALAWIVGFRVAQGVFGAIMIPAALAVVVSSFEVRERGRAMAIFFGVSGGFTAIGPIAGGYLTKWTWRSIFWINVPIAVLAIVLTIAAGIAESARAETIDWKGAALVAAGMALSVLGFEEVPTWGWSSPWTWLCIIGGLIILVIFVRVEMRTETPLLKLQVFRDRAFTIDNAVLFLSMIAFVPVFFFASVYSQVSLGYDASNAGLYLMVFFAGFAPASQISGRMLDAGGARRPIVLGCALATAGFAWWGAQITELQLGKQWYAIVLAGAGIGFLLGPASTDAVNRAIRASYGEVTGISQTLRNYGSTLGIAVLGTLLTTVFADRLTSTVAGLGVPRDVAHSIALSGSGGDIHSASAASGPPALQRAISAAVKHDFALGMRAVLYGMAAALAVALVVSLFHPGDRVRRTQDPQDAQTTPEPSPVADEPQPVRRSS
jgi:EmrB/QacA subfamily drug resistance transporter